MVHYFYIVAFPVGNNPKTANFTGIMTSYDLEDAGNRRVPAFRYVDGWSDHRDLAAIYGKALDERDVLDVAVVKKDLAVEAEME